MTEGYYLAYHVDGAHQDLIQMPVLHQFRVIHNGVLEARPDFLPQIFFVELQAIAQVL